MTRPIRNVPESVKQRLSNLARTRGVTVNEVLQFYAMERFLYRLGRSTHRDRLLLKGALLLQAWRLVQSRTTRDIDLLGKTGNSLDNVSQMIAEVCALDYSHEDGMIYDSDTIQAVRIKEEAEYEGVRVLFDAHLGSARLPMQIDIGFNDVVTPKPQPLEYPPLLDSPAPTLMGYTPETMIAEKIEAMIVLDVLNSRMKDFFDVWLLSRHLAFDLQALASAHRNTLTRRGTPLYGIPTLLEAPDQHPAKEKQWSAFVRKSNLGNAPAHFNDVAQAVRAFVEPALNVLIADQPAPNRSWIPPGPWGPPNDHPVGDRKQATAPPKRSRHA